MNAVAMDVQIFIYFSTREAKSISDRRTARAQTDRPLLLKIAGPRTYAY